MSNMKQWMEEYQCERFKFELPEVGKRTEAIECPICSQRVTISLFNVASQYFVLRSMLLVWAILCFALAAALYFVMANGNQVVIGVAAAIASMGFVCLIGTVFGDKLPANWFKNYLVSITHDDVRNHAQAPGYSGMRGHKLLEIEVK